MKLVKLILPLFMVLLLSACQKADVLDEPSLANHPASASLSNTVNKNVMLLLVNEAREKGCNCGDTYYNPAPAVSWNNVLEQAAYAHAKDMYQNNYFSHTSPDGSGPGDRISRAGYDWQAFGENLGKGYTSERAVIEAWLKSTSHCKALMDPRYKEMGVARVGNYWVQEFGAR